MQLVIAIVQDEDRKKLADAFTKANVRATRLSSTGGFLKAGNTTFLIGIEKKRVDEVLEIIKKNSQKRIETVPAPVDLDMTLAGLTQTTPVEIEIGGAIVFVVPVESFHRF